MPDSHAVVVTVTWKTAPDTHRAIVTVRPQIVQVGPGDTIHFKRAGDAEGRMRITFKEKQCFETNNATGTFHEGEGDVRVKTMPRRMGYVCELLDADGKPIPQSPPNAGGETEPVKK